MNRTLAGTVCLAVLVAQGTTKAECLPTLSIRDLILNAPTIVVATPIDPLQDTRQGAFLPVGSARFKVVEVLGGVEIKVGDTVRISDLGIYFLGAGNGDFPQPGDAPAEVDKALLFLKWANSGADRIEGRPELSGVRYLTKGGDVLRPYQLHNPGPYYMTPMIGTEWKTLIKRVKAEALELESPLYKRAAKIEWKFDDQTNLLRCVLDYSGDRQLGVHLGPHRSLIVCFRDDKNKLIYSWDGHYQSVFTTKENILYHADYSHNSSGCKLVAVDLKNGKQLWSTSLKGLGPVEHSKYRNAINLEFDGEVLTVFGKESSGRYVEVVDAKTGKTVGHKVFKEKE